MAKYYDRESLAKNIIDNHIEILNNEVSSIDNAVYANDKITRMNLRLIVKGKHPLLNEHTPLPLPADIDGKIISGPMGMLFDMHTQSERYSHNSYMSMDEAKKYGIDKYVDAQVLVPLQSVYRSKTPYENDKYGKEAVVKMFNIERIKKIKPELIDKIMPDYHNLDSRWNDYTKKQREIIKSNGSDSLSESNKAFNTELGHSYLPKLTLEMRNYEISRRLGKTFKPMFTQEEHIIEIAKLIQNNPRYIKSAFQQSSKIVDNYITKAFTDRKLSNSNKIENTHNQGRKM